MECYQNLPKQLDQQPLSKVQSAECRVQSAKCKMQVQRAREAFGFLGATKEYRKYRTPHASGIRGGILLLLRLPVLWAKK
jgi:hypothetical protein